MTFWSETPGDAKGGWHWIGIATSLAFTLGLHRKIDAIALDPGERRLRRRIWWSCYIRDRMFALVLNRPWRIRDGEYDTPMLTLADFEINEAPSDDLEMTTHSPVEGGMEEVKLAQVNIAMAQLCTMIGDVLNLHFSILPEEDASLQSNDGTGNTSTLLFARRQANQIDRVQAYDQKLQAWSRDRPSSCVYSPTGSSSSIVHVAFLNHVFFSIVSALHRPLLRPNALADFVEYQMLSQRRVQNAAIEITKMSRDLHSHGLARYLPAAAAFFQLPAIIIFLRELRSPNNQEPRDIFDSILSCINVVDDIMELHVGADLAMSFSLDLLKRSDILPRTDQDSKRIIGLCYGSHMHRSNDPSPNCGTCYVSEENSNISRPLFHGGSDTENALGRQIFAPNPSDPGSRSFIFDAGLPPPFNSEMHFPTSEENPDNFSNMLINWKLMPSMDDWYLGTFQPDLSTLIG